MQEIWILLGTGFCMGLGLGLLWPQKKKEDRAVRGFVVLNRGDNIERELRRFQARHGENRGFFILGAGEDAGADTIAQQASKAFSAVRWVSEKEGQELLDRLMTRGAVAEVYTPRQKGQR